MQDPDSSHVAFVFVWAENEIADIKVGSGAGGISNYATAEPSDVGDE